MSASLEKILAQALQQLSEVTDLNQLDQVRVQYLGKKGEFTLQMKELGKLDPEQRRSVGQIINDAKDQFQEKLEACRAVLEAAALSPTAQGTARRTEGCARTSSKHFQGIRPALRST